MVIYIGADHRGFKLKNILVPYLRDMGREVVDCGAETLNMDDDYPTFALKVAREVAKNPESDKGILICGSGGGMNIAANKVKGIRCSLAISLVHVNAARRDDDINVVALPADFISEQEAKDIVKAFIETPFSGQQRYIRRIQELNSIEHE